MTEQHNSCTKDKIIEKLESNIERTKEQLNTLDKVVTVQVEKTANNEKDIVRLIDDTKNLTMKINNTEREISEELLELEDELIKKLDHIEKKLSDEHASLEKRLDKFDTYKYVVIAFFTVIAFVLDHFDVFSTLTGITK